MDAPVLILDDALSSVDNQTATQILENLSQGVQRKTVIFISHQLSAAATADRICVMEAGQIIQTGTHAELLQQPGLYHSLGISIISKKYSVDTPRAKAAGILVPSGKLQFPVIVALLLQWLESKGVVSGCLDTINTVYKIQNTNESSFSGNSTVYESTILPSTYLSALQRS
jgi:ABC-type multidrug transport system ATPase subunit